MEPAATPLGRPSRPPAYERRASRARTLVALPFAALFVSLFAVLVLGSLRPVGLPPPRSVELIPPTWAFGNYAEVFSTVPMARYLRNSLIVAAVAVPVSVVVASWAGFAIARLPRSAGAFLVALCVVVLMIPATALFVGRVTVFRWLGLTDTLIPLMAPALLGMSPLFVVFFAWSFRRLPEALFDLAREAGCGPVAQWWRVGVPLTRGTAGTVAALAFLVSWGNFLDPLIYVYDERWFTLPIGIRSLATLPSTDQPLMLAGATIAVAPVLVVFAVIQRRFLSDRPTMEGVRRR
ncbi:MAG: carbohydrate ABC transporter permease [Actinomycetota bacterium]